MYQYHLILWKMLFITIHWFWNTILLRVTTTKMIKTPILNAHIANVIFISPPKTTWTARGKRRYLRRHGEGLSATPRDSKDQRKQLNKITERERVSYIVTFIMALFSLSNIYFPAMRSGGCEVRREWSIPHPPVTPQPRVSVPVTSRREWQSFVISAMTAAKRCTRSFQTSWTNDWICSAEWSCCLCSLLQERHALHMSSVGYIVLKKIKPDTQGSKKNSHWL